LHTLSSTTPWPPPSNPIWRLGRSSPQKLGCRLPVLVIGSLGRSNSPMEDCCLAGASASAGGSKDRGGLAEASLKDLRTLLCEDGAASSPPIDVPVNCPAA